MSRWMIVCLLCLIIAAPLSAEDDDPYTIALQRIQEAAASEATELILSELDLTELPPEIGQLTNLEKLTVEFTLISNLPPEVWQLTNLQELSICANQLTSLPPEISQLINLQVLSLDANDLTTVPPEVGQLTKLKILSLNANQLISLPSEIGQLTDLQSLSLAFNGLTGLPPEIGMLKNLSYLDLSYNQLTALPPEIGQLGNLRELYLANNQLRTLPPELGNLTSLTCSDGCYLYLQYNPLISPPPEVVEQGKASVLAYLRNQTWYHIQRLIVGAASGVGLLALLLLGFRFKQRGGRKLKQKRIIYKDESV